jgi:hypothetical protein
MPFAIHFDTSRTTGPDRMQQHQYQHQHQHQEQQQQQLQQQLHLGLRSCHWYR